MKMLGRGGAWLNRDRKMRDLQKRSARAEETRELRRGTVSLDAQPPLSEAELRAAMSDDPRVVILPRGVSRPPLVTVRQETPPYVYEYQASYADPTQGSSSWDGSDTARADLGAKAPAAEADIVVSSSSTPNLMHTHAYQCRICKLLTMLGDAKREAVEKMLADSSVTAYAASKSITERGYPVSSRSVDRHRSYIKGQ